MSDDPFATIYPPFQWGRGYSNNEYIALCPVDGERIKMEVTVNVTFALGSSPRSHVLGIEHFDYCNTSPSEIRDGDAVFICIRCGSQYTPPSDITEFDWH